MEYYQYIIILLLSTLPLSMLKDYIEVSYEHKKLKHR